MSRGVGDLVRLRSFRIGSHRAFASRIAFQAVAAASGVVIGGLTARWLGPEGKGLLALLLLVGHVVSTVASLGMNDATAYLVHRRGIPSCQFVGAIPHHLLAIGLPVAVILAAALVSQGGGLWRLRVTEAAVVYVAARVVTRIAILLCRGVLRAQERFDAVLAVDLIEVVGPLGILVAFSVGGHLDVATALLAFLLAALGAAAVGWSLTYAGGGRGTFQAWQAHLRATAGYGGSVVARFVGTITVQRVNFFVIAAMMGVEQLGYYSVAIAVVDVLGRVPDAASWVLIPLTAKTTDSAAHATTMTYARSVVALTLAGSLVFLVFGRVIITAVFTADFLPALPALYPLLGAAVVFAYATVIESSLLGRGAARAVAVATWIGGALTVLGDLFLVPPLGLRGAAFATCIGYAATAALLTVAYRRHREPDRVS